MSNLLPLERWVRGIEYATMSGLLADFRQNLECDSGQPIESMELNAALVLHDLCQFLGLGEEQRQKVLGRKATVYLERALSERIDLSRVH